MATMRDGDETGRGSEAKQSGGPEPVYETPKRTGDAEDGQDEGPSSDTPEFKSHDERIEYDIFGLANLENGDAVSGFLTDRAVDDARGEFVCSEASSCGSEPDDDVSEAETPSGPYAPIIIRNPIEISREANLDGPFLVSGELETRTDTPLLERRTAGEPFAPLILDNTDDLPEELEVDPSAYADRFRADEPGPPVEPETVQAETDTPSPEAMKPDVPIQAADGGTGYAPVDSGMPQPTTGGRPIADLDPGEILAVMLDVNRGYSSSSRQQSAASPGSDLDPGEILSLMIDIRRMRNGQPCTGSRSGTWQRGDRERDARDADPSPAVFIGLCIASLFFGTFSFKGIVGLDPIVLGMVIGGGALMLVGGGRANRIGRTPLAATGTILGTFWLMMGLICGADYFDITVGDLSFCLFLCVWGAMALLLSISIPNVNLVSQLALMFTAAGALLMSVSYYDYSFYGEDFIKASSVTFVIAGLVGAYAGIAGVANADAGAHVLPLLGIKRVPVLVAKNDRGEDIYIGPDGKMVSPGRVMGKHAGRRSRGPARKEGAPIRPRKVVKVKVDAAGNYTYMDADGNPMDPPRGAPKRARSSRRGARKRKPGSSP